MPRQTYNSGGLVLAGPSSIADPRKPQSHENSLDNNKTSISTELQERLNQMAEQLRQMQEARAPAPVSSSYLMLAEATVWETVVGSSPESVT
jgi:hypothetical protein